MMPHVLDDMTSIVLDIGLHSLGQFDRKGNLVLHNEVED